MHASLSGLHLSSYLDWHCGATSSKAKRTGLRLNLEVGLQQPNIPKALPWWLLYKVYADCGTWLR